MPAIRSAAAGLLRTLFREPLTRFAMLGAALFAAHAQFAAPQRPAERLIDIPAQVTAMIATRHLLETGAPPGEAELRAAIDELVEEEILYRHALALGLERGDPIVRRRLVQKARLLVEDSHVAPEPDRSDLQQFLAAHAERYRQPERRSFRHVYLPAQQGVAPLGACEVLAASIDDNTDPGTLGRPFPLGRHQIDRSQTEVERDFGPAFAAAVFALQPDQWSEPLTSRYGCHVVRTEDHRAARLPGVDELQMPLTRDWRAAWVEKENRVALDQLRAAYTVTVAPAAESGSPTQLASSPPDLAPETAH